jgi:hypothetical protein
MDEQAGLTRFNFQSSKMRTLLVNSLVDFPREEWDWALVHIQQNPPHHGASPAILPLDRARIGGG